MDATWTLSELVDEATAALARVPAPDNGQIRAVPDERSLRYYTTLGLLDRPAALRGRTALYNRRHLAQVVAIKRMQTAGKSLAEIQQILAAIDDATLTRLSGISQPRPSRAARPGFWRVSDPDASRGPDPIPVPVPVPAPVPVPVPVPDPIAVAVAVPAPVPAPIAAPIPTLTLRLSLAPGLDLLINADSAHTATFASLDLPALAAAAEPLISELIRQRLHPAPAPQEHRP